MVEIGHFLYTPSSITVCNLFDLLRLITKNLYAGLKYIQYATTYKNYTYKSIYFKIIILYYIYEFV